MIYARDVVEYVFSIAPNPAWANENIYEAGGPDRAVTGIGLAWWITSQMLGRFEGLGLNMGVTHEKITYPMPENYKWGAALSTEELPANKRIVGLCLERGITVHRFHSNIDMADWGMPRAVIGQMGWEGCEQDWSRGVPVITIPEVALGELAQQVKAGLGVPFVRFDGDLKRKVTRVALAWGGLCQHWAGAGCALPLGYDVLIGGDIIDGVVRFAREHDFAVLDAMHHATEWEAMRVLGRKIQGRFPGLKVVEFDNGSPWAGVV